MKHPIYNIFNVVYQLIGIWFLIIANAFLNIRVIADNASTLFKILLLLAEGAVVITLINMINRLALHDTEGKEESIKIAGRTSKVNSVITVLLIVMIYWEVF